MHGMVSELREQVQQYLSSKQRLVEGEKMFLALLGEAGKAEGGQEERNSCSPGLRISRRRLLKRKRRALLSDMTFQLKFFGDWSLREIATLCRCQPSTVRSRYYHGMERMYSRFPWAFERAPDWMRKKLKTRKRTRELME